MLVLAATVSPAVSPGCRKSLLLGPLPPQDTCTPAGDLGGLHELAVGYVRGLPDIRYSVKKMFNAVTLMKDGLNRAHSEGHIYVIQDVSGKNAQNEKFESTYFELRYIN